MSNDTITWKDELDGRRYTDQHGNEIGMAYYDTDRREFRFHDHSQTCPWAEEAGSPTLTTFDRIAWAVNAHLIATGH